MSVYLNHASISPMLPEVRKSIDQFLDLYETGDFRYYPKLLELTASIKSSVSRLIGTAPNQIGLSPNTATSMALLANGIEWQPSDEIIIVEGDFPSATLPFVSVAEQKQIQLRVIPEAKYLEDPIQSVENEINANTRLFVTSSVGFMTGVRYPISELTRLCHHHNALIAIDVTQSAGVVPLDLAQVPVDFVAGSTYKWLRCPLGCAFFALSEDLLNHCSPSVVGWLANHDPADMRNTELHLKSDAGKFASGGIPIIDLVGTDTALRTLGTIGFDQISSATLSLSHYLTEKLIERQLPLVANYSTSTRSGIVTIANYPKAEALFEHLSHHQIMTTYRNKRLRLSPHYYQRNSDIDTALAIIDEFLT